MGTRTNREGTAERKVTEGAEVRTDEIGYKSEEMRDDGAREQMRATRGGKDVRGDSRERGAGGRERREMARRQT